MHWFVTGGGGVAPCWVIVNVFPATSSVAVREAVLVLAPAVNCTEPAPVPVDPAVITTQSAPLEAVQPQPVGAVTATDALPPEASTFCVFDESLNEQFGRGASACVRMTG